MSYLIPHKVSEKNPEIRNVYYLTDKGILFYIGIETWLNIDMINHRVMYPTIWFSEHEGKLYTEEEVLSAFRRYKILEIENKVNGVIDTFISQLNQDKNNGK